MKDSNPPPPYCSGGQRETGNVVSAFGANPLEEAEELDPFSRFCTVQGIGIGIDMLIGACIHQSSISGS